MSKDKNVEIFGQFDNEVMLQFDFEFEVDSCKVIQYFFIIKLRFFIEVFYSF